AAAGTIYVVARYAPFPAILKWLFAFGYYPFFEYGVVSRCYVLGLFFFFIACALMVSATRRNNVILLACVLLLLCQTSIFGVILAIALAMTYAFDRLVIARFRNEGATQPARPIATALASLIVLAGIALAVWQVLPPGDNTIVT